MDELTIHKSIFPVVKAKLGEQLSECQFIGTGFFVGSDLRILTAKHVFSNLSEGEEFFAVDMTKAPLTFHLITRRDTSSPLDIASGFCESFENAVGLELLDSPLHANDVVLSAEFSRSRPVLSRGQNLLKLQTAHHKGYIVSSFFDEDLNTDLIEVSFPAIKGASGSPIIRESDFKVIGLVFQNRGRDFLPVQIDNYLSEDGQTMEEVKFYMPNAVAIRYDSVRNYLQNLPTNQRRKPLLTN